MQDKSRRPADRSVGVSRSFCPAFFQPPQTANCVWTVVCEHVPQQDRTDVLSLLVHSPRRDRHRLTHGEQKRVFFTHIFRIA